jgi:hypothetical protein
LAAFQSASISSRLAVAGVAPRAGFETPEQVMNLVKEDVANFTRVLRAAGVQPE